MTNFLGYKCSLCGKEYAPDAVTYTCPSCGVMGNLDVVLDYAKIKKTSSQQSISESRDNSIWRYEALLPLEPQGLKELQSVMRVGWTPMYRAARLASALGLKNLFVKDDGRNPTASFKDRASAIVVARAKEINAPVIAAASTGNAGAALSGMAAAAGSKSIIFAPKTAPQAKVAQLLMFGARVLLVDGNYDQAFDLCVEASNEFGWYCRNTGYNPFTVEGKKTASFEICEQLGNQQFVAPDRVFVSVGDGNIISGIWKGFKDLLALGWIDKVPKLIGVQSEGSAACANAWRDSTETITPVVANTLADSISVDLPRDGVRAVRAVRETKGSYVVVSDEEILSAMRDLARGVAVFAEPAGATAYAGLVKAVKENLVDANETILVMNTGNGLKDVKAAMQAAGNAPIIEANLKDVRRVIS